MATDNDIFNLLNPAYFARMLPLEPTADDLPYFAEKLFSVKKSNSPKLEFLKGYKEGSRLAPLSTFDSNYSRKGRQGLKSVWSDFPFVRFAKGLTEAELYEIDTTLNEIATLGNNEASEALQIAFKNVFDDVPGLLKDIRSLRELMRFQVLTTNGVSIESMDYNGQPVQFDASFDVPGDTPWTSDHVISTTVAWEKNTANPLTDLMNFIKAARKLNQTVIRRLYMGSRLYSAMLSNPNTREQLSFGNGVTPSIATSEAVRTWLQAHGAGRVEIITEDDYNNTYTGYDGVGQEFLDSTKIIGLPEGQVGTMVLGPTPIETIRKRNSSTRVEITSDRIAVHPYVTAGEPITYDVIVSARFAPTGENMDQVFNFVVPLP
jgi:hypothetical protein